MLFGIDHILLQTLHIDVGFLFLSVTGKYYSHLRLGIHRLLGIHLLQFSKQIIRSLLLLRIQLTVGDGIDIHPLQSMGIPYIYLLALLLTTLHVGHLIDNDLTEIAVGLRENILRGSIRTDKQVQTGKELHHLAGHTG